MSAIALPAGEQTKLDDRDVSVDAFAVEDAAYYNTVFEKLQRGTLPLWSLNKTALLVPWLWAARRGVWLMFWLALAFDVIALTCVLQLVKYGPLLAEAQLDAAANTTLIARYSGWMTNFGWIGVTVFVLGRLIVSAYANRWYYGQYSRWRINDAVPHGVDTRRVILGAVIIALTVPLTLYRSTEQRLDERVCFNQIRAAEGTETLMASYGAASPDDLIAQINAQRGTLETERTALAAIGDPSAEQKKRLTEIRRVDRSLGRDANLVQAYLDISAKDRFDCFFIDDFPTLARIDPPEDVSYRRVPDEAAIAAGKIGATRLETVVKPPVEGRKVSIFTYSSESIDISINHLRAKFATTFDAITNVLRQSLIRVEVGFMLTPWPVVAFLILALSWAYAGPGTTVFVASSLGFLAIFELWQIAMQTMALVVVSTAVCVLVGLPVGIWMAKNKWARWITEPILDVMQTIPSLSYLVPAVAFFGISQPPAVLATVIFAIPPMVKLTALGIRQVPGSTKEAALAFGASQGQLLRKVELPMAVPSIMAGLNQTIMLALSMATISAFIGAEGLGALVTSSLGDAQAGKGLLAGIAIALVAMMIDRILKGIRASFSKI